MSGLGFGVLGPLEVVRDGGRVAVTAPKLRVVLAALLVRANATVSVDHLAERLWADHPPATARKSVQLHVLRLRRILGDHTEPAGLIETRPDGYLMRLEPGQLDLLRFRRLTESARQAARSGDLVAELSWLNEALACWRGRALSDVPSESLQREVVAQLAEDRLRATERRMRVHLDLGRHREIIAELVQLTKDHPWQESFWVQLIVALHQSDRLADALDTYRTVRRRFADELGVEPGPELRRVHDTILADRPETAGEQADEAHPPAPMTCGCQLPADVHRFVGRAVPIGRLTGLSNGAGEQRRAVVVSGPPGVGKTALAVHVAHLLRPHYADGQLYMNLQGHAADPALAPAAALSRFLDALGVPRDRVPVELDDRAALFRSLLTGRKMLLLLDNAEHADQVRPLLPAEPGCAVLITSRNDLRGLTVSPGADHLPLGVLTPEESTAVLTDLVGPDRAAAEPHGVAELARTCAHLPLALRIAGANLAADPHRGIADYTAELSRSGRLSELAIDGDERSAVRVAFDQSYLSLGTADRRLFRLLGLAPGPDVGAAAAAALAGTAPPRTARALDRLAAANLLHQHAPGRYQFHDLIREYATDRAHAEDPAEEVIAARTRLVDFYLHTAAATAHLLYPGTPWLSRPDPGTPPAQPATEATARRWLDEERFNLLAAATWAASRPGWHRYAWQLVDVLRGYLQASGQAGDAVAACTAALRAATAAGDRPAQISLFDILGLISHDLSDFRRAAGYQRQAVLAARETGDLDAEANALRSLGRSHAHQGQSRQALRCYRQALAVSRKAGNSDAEALAMNFIGVTTSYLGDPRTAIPWHQRSLALSRETGNRRAIFRALNGRGIAHWALGRLDDAIADQEQVLAYCREVGELIGEVAALNCLAETNCDAAHFEPAMDQATESLRRCVDVGERRAEATAREIIATVRDRRGEHAAAIEGYLEAQRLARHIGYAYGETSTLIGLAAAHRALGDPRHALTHGEQALTRLRGHRHLLLEATALTELAHDHLDLGDLNAATDDIHQAIHKARERGQALTEQRALQVRELIRQAKDG